MAIKGLTERRLLPRLGKIHLGIKVKNEDGVEYPRMLDYFVCPPEVKAVFGERPKELRIIIPVEDEERWATQYYRCYSKTKGLVCKGDGETAMRMVDVKTGALADRTSKKAEMREVACAGRHCPYYEHRCKEVMNLRFLLPEVPGMGVWQVDSSSINSIKNINSAAFLIKQLYGRISMLPLLLTFEPMMVISPVDGKRKRVSALNLRTKESMVDLMQIAAMKPADMLLRMPVADDEPGEMAPEMAEAEAADGLPATAGELMALVSAHGKQYNRTWLNNTFSFTEEDMEQYPDRCWLEIRDATGW
ncbi:MAG: hypothetical protein ABH839_00255 [Chloroflexota bacterium]